MSYPVYASKGVLVAVATTVVNTAYPSTVNANDLLLLHVTIDNEAVGSESPPSGFSYLQGIAHVGSGFRMALYYKRATGSESGSVAFTWDYVPNSIATGIMYRFTNVVTSGNWWINNNNESVSSATSTAYTSVVNTYGNNQALVISIICTIGHPSITTADNYIELAYDTTAFGAGCSIKLQYQLVPAPGVVAQESSVLGSSVIWNTNTVSIESANPGWPHNFLSVDNRDLYKISDLQMHEISSINDTE